MKRVFMKFSIFLIILISLIPANDKGQPESSK